MLFRAHGPSDSSPNSQQTPKPVKVDRGILAVTLLAFAICCAGWVWLASVFPQTGWDFTEFYLAGNVPVRSLYDQQVFGEYGARLLKPLGVEYYPPYVRPAIFSLPLHGMMGLPYWTAYVVFAGLQFACYLGALYLLWKRFAFPVELIVGFGLFYPGMMGIVTGQDANGLALMLATGLVLLLDGRQKAAGIVLALCLYKFNITLLLPVLLLVNRKYEALKWFCGAGALLAIGSALVSPPAQYIELLRTIPQYTIGFSAEKMIGLRSLAESLGPSWLFYVFAALTAAMCVWAMRRLPLAEGFCVAVLGALLCAYHVNWYDGAIVLVPMAVAFGSEAKLPKIVTAPLLFFFPLWAAYPRVIAGLIVLLLAAFAFSAERRKAVSEVPAPAL